MKEVQDMLNDGRKLLESFTSKENIDQLISDLKNLYDLVQSDHDLVEYFHDLKGFFREILMKRGDNLSPQEEADAF